MKKITLLLLLVFTYCAVATGQSTINITTSGGSYPGEKWVSITTMADGAGTQVFGQGNGTQCNGAGLINQDIELDPGTYYVNCYDQYDDSWDGTLIVVTAYGVIIGDNGGTTPDDGEDTDASSSCDGTQEELEASFMIVVPNPPSCTNPEDIVVDAVQFNAADFSWDTGIGATTYDWEVVPAGNGQGNGVLDSGTTSSLSASATGLSASSSYDFFIKSDCESVYTAPVSFTTPAPPPINDECANAIALTVNADESCGSVTAGTTLGATASPQPDDAPGTPNNDVWFTFQATATNNNIVISNIVNQGGGTSTSTDMAMSVFNDADGCNMTAANEVGESDPNTLELSGLTIGNIYYVRVYGWNSNIQNNTFDICVGTPPPPPPGDTCSIAIDLDNETSPLSATTSDAEHDFDEDCLTTVGKDLVYSVTVPDGFTLTIGQTANDYDSVSRIAYGGNCPGDSLIACYDFGELDEYEWTNDTGVEQEVYYIQSGYYSTSDGDFTLEWSVEAPPSCTNPENISVENIQLDAADFSWEAGIGATNYDWEVVPSGNGQGNGVIDSGTTSSLAASASGLSPNTEYDFYIKSDCETNYSDAVSFTTLAVPPVNDDCANAIALTVNADESCGTVTAGTTLGATASPQPDDATGTPNNDVWFTFEATASNNIIVISNVVNLGGGTSTSTDMGMSVFNDADGCNMTAANEVGESDPNTLELTGLTIGNTYYVRVYGWNSDIQNNNFDICVGTPPPPATDSCGAYSSSPDLFITDGSPVEDIINAPDTGFQTLTDLNVVLKIDHTYLGDLDIVLTSPSGTSVLLFENNCGTNENMEIMLDDEGVTLVCASPTEGIVTPDNPLSAFDGEIFQGNWTLDVIDTAGGDDGTLIQWCLIPTLEASACVSTTTWNGSIWDNGAPDVATAAIFNGNYNTGTNGNIDACAILISSGTTVTIEAATYMNVDGNIVVDGNLDVLHEGSLVQIDPTAATTNSGSIMVEKITPLLSERDFMIMGSPMTAETRDGVYGNAVMVREHNTSNFVPNADVAAAFPGANNFADDNGNNFLNYSGTINAGEGYLVRPQNTPTESGSYTLSYSQGTLNNGTVNFEVVFNTDQNSSPNMMGNPYASAIDADLFVAQNSSLVDVIYFWEHLTAPSDSYPGYNPNNYDMGDISQYNASLGAGVAAANGGDTPTKFIASGQGFAVKALAAGTATFNNDMRVTTNNDTYRSPIDRELLYVNVFNETYNLGSTALIAYTDASTIGLDQGFDNSRLATPVSLYSVCETPYTKLGIQSRGAFDIEDKFFLGFSSQVVEDQTYRISLSAFEGLNLENVDVILVDNLEDETVNLKEVDYTFQSHAGDSPERFTILYREASLNSEDATLADVSLYPNPADDILHIVSQTSTIEKVAIMDMRGRLIITESLGGSTMGKIDVSQLDAAVYFVKISASEGSVTKRLIVE
ncbi:proprotein convertase P-domain-containing protein [Luteirhabdus pelagi]|uniref:proprotein convertase P-domain-containing protein n=1 Tax=Luteirhabdus pelagi TaxID=2792783 RepID=UPI00193AC375|nr:proprotein convertase P-domain-containing protein [Luteirhabdus pelagi]